MISASRLSVSTDGYFLVDGKEIAYISDAGYLRRCHFGREADEPPPIGGLQFEKAGDGCLVVANELAEDKADEKEDES